MVKDPFQIEKSFKGEKMSSPASNNCTDKSKDSGGNTCDIYSVHGFLGFMHQAKYLGFALQPCNEICGLLRGLKEDNNIFSLKIVP